MPRPGRIVFSLPKEDTWFLDDHADLLQDILGVRLELQSSMNMNDSSKNDLNTRPEEDRVLVVTEILKTGLLVASTPSSLCVGDQLVAVNRKTNLKSLDDVLAAVAGDAADPLTLTFVAPNGHTNLVQRIFNTPSSSSRTPPQWNLKISKNKIVYWDSNEILVRIHRSQVLQQIDSEDCRVMLDSLWTVSPTLSIYNLAPRRSSSAPRRLLWWRRESKRTMRDGSVATELDESVGSIEEEVEEPAVTQFI